MTRPTDDQTKPARATARVLVVDADRAMTGLLQEWLGPQGCTVVDEMAQGAASAEPFDLAIVDVPFPRQGGAELIRRVASHHPATPILALSSNFCASIECHGAVAHALGVACVMPKPASREALVDTVRNLLPR